MENKASTKDVCKAFGVTRQTVAHWVKQGCPAKKRGRRFQFDMATVEAWRAERDGFVCEENLARRRLPEETKDSEAAPKYKPARTFTEDDDSDKSPGQVYQEARAKKTKHEADLKELDLQTKKRHLLPADTVKEGRLKRIHAVKAGLYGMCARAAPELVGKDEKAIYKTLKREVDKVLRQFARGSGAKL